MSFYASNNNITITDATGSEMFNTDNKMPFVASILESSITLPSRGYTSSSSTSSYYIGNSPAGSNYVLSSCRIEGGSNYPWKDSSFNSSGSTITNLGWQDLGSGNWRIAAARTVTFRVDTSGDVYLDEEYYNLLGSVNLGTFELFYKIYVGKYE